MSLDVPSVITPENQTCLHPAGPEMSCVAVRAGGEYLLEQPA